jgi:DNA-binding MarR family transcriptional regulator
LPDFVDSTVKDIDARLSALKDEVTKLEAARGGNTRANQALELVRSQPGITIPQLAEAMKIQPNYLYRVMPRLVKDGHIKRDGQGWKPA